METTLNIVSIIIIVFGILQIILFFKVWGMTNNVSEMKNMMELFLRKEFQEKNQCESIQKKSSTPNLATDERRWNNEVTEDEIGKAKSIIPHLDKGEVIIKLIKSNKIIVYNENDLYELADEEYKMIYY